jgi:hypothetical protein
VPPLAAVPDLERELDELYGLPLEEWTRARNDLAARLRKAHQGEQADTVKALRKPSVPTWAINQLARREEGRMAALLAAGERLRKAQEQALRGKAVVGDVNAAARTEREAVRDLVNAARSILADVGHPATQPVLDRISQTLRAAAVDESSRAQLEHGRLLEEVAGGGFGSLVAVRPVPRPRTDELREARERVKELRGKAKALAREAREADAAASRAERDAERAREQAQAKNEEAARVATVLAEAEAELSSRRSQL